MPDGNAKILTQHVLSLFHIDNREEIQMTNTNQASFRISLDENGLLQHPEHWNHDVAQLMATQLDIDTLNDEHWKVIDALRAHYDRFASPPAIHHICHEHQQNDYWVHDLFHTCFNAWRVAGLPDPGEEAKAYLNDM
jgi:tRNA 2-thiouridine synthesizing protein E